MTKQSSGGGEGGAIGGKRGWGQWSVARGGCSPVGGSYGFARLRQAVKYATVIACSEAGRGGRTLDAQFPAFCTTLHECPACKVDLFEGRTSSKGGRAWCHGKNVMYTCVCDK